MTAIPTVATPGNSHPDPQVTRVRARSGRRELPVRRDGYPWSLIVAFVAFSAWGNSLHAPAGGMTLRLVAATPPLAAALSWHLLVLPSFGESAWRRWLARAVAAAVFGYTMWGSWSSLTSLGLRAALPHPTVLPVGVDGLVFVAAVAVWSRAVRVATEPAEAAGSEPDAEPVVSPIVEPAWFGCAPSGRALLSIVAAPSVSPVVEPVRKAQVSPVRRARSRDELAARRQVRCDCGCGRMVSKATRTRDRARQRESAEA